MPIAWAIAPAGSPGGQVGRDYLVSLIRQAGDQIKRPQDLARCGLAAKGALKDRGDLARAIDVAERAVDGEAKVAVAARQGQRIGLDAQIVVGQPQLVGRLAVLDQKQQDRAVAEIRRYLTLVEHRQA